MSNRLQNVVVTLDKVKMVLEKGGNQGYGPCLRLLDDEEAVQHLWSGEPGGWAQRAGEWRAEPSRGGPSFEELGKRV